MRKARCGVRVPTTTQAYELPDAHPLYARGRSYRELPSHVRIGTVTATKSLASFKGSPRCGFTQDDAHIYCTHEQMPGELDSLLTFVLNPLRDYGLEDFCPSYRPATRRSPSAVKTSGTRTQVPAKQPPNRISKILDEGGAAFMDPISARRTPSAERGR